MGGCLELGVLGALFVWSVAIGRSSGGAWQWLVSVPLGAVVAILAGVLGAIVAHVAGNPEGAVFLAVVFTSVFRGLLVAGVVLCGIGSLAAVSRGR